MIVTSEIKIAQMPEAIWKAATISSGIWTRAILRTTMKEDFENQGVASRDLDGIIFRRILVF
jgi:hypothetical protein